MDFMNKFVKSSLLVVAAVVGMTLAGCGSSLDSNTFNVELGVEDISNLYSQNQVVNIITIRSNSPYPINVTNVLINNGECRYEGYRRLLAYPQHFKMDFRLILKLTGCGYDKVERVDVETEKGTASYSF